MRWTCFETPAAAASIYDTSFEAHLSYGIRPPEFRLPDTTRVGSVCLEITDLERSVDFYSAVLGFSVLAHDSSAALLGVGSRGLIELHLAASRRQPPNRLGLYHFAILLPDRPALGRCAQHLVELGIQIGGSDHWVSEALYLHDPDGLGIEIYRDRPRSEWRTKGRELALATEALDFAGLQAAANGRPWDAMPEGTSMGHVHLHVGDLDAARQFYHTALGLDLVVWSYPGALFLSAGGYHHHLGVNSWAGPQAQAPSQEEAKLRWWELLLPSREAVTGATDSLAASGYTVTSEEDGACLAADPWQTLMRLKMVV